MPAKQSPKNKKWRFRKMVDGVTLRSRYIYLTRKAAELAEAEAVATYIRTGQIITLPLKADESQRLLREARKGAEHDDELRRLVHRVEGVDRDRADLLRRIRSLLGRH